MTWSWKVARIAGIDVYVHATFLMVVAWIAMLYWNQSQSLVAVVEGVGFILVQMKSALAGIPVRRAMLTEFGTLTATNTLGDAADLVLMGSQQDFPVVGDGRVEGILTRSDLLQALTRSGRNASVGENMRRECATADASEMLEAVLARLQGHDCHTVPITERGALIGLVTMDNVGEFLMIQAAERKSPLT